MCNKDERLDNLEKINLIYTDVRVVRGNITPVQLMARIRKAAIDMRLLIEENERLRDKEN